MTPLEMIETGIIEMMKAGIVSESMNKIKKGYETLARKQITIGREEPDFIAPTNADFSRGAPDGKRPTKKIPIKISNANMFADSGENGDKVNRPQKTPRKVVKSNIFVDVSCKECGDSFRINRALLPTSVDDAGGNVKEKRKPYTCDDCLARRR